MGLVRAAPGALCRMEGEPRPTRDEDRRHEEWLIRKQRITIRAMILTPAVCVARRSWRWCSGSRRPLRCLALGCCSTAWLCWSSPNHVEVVARSKQRMVGGPDLVMAVVFLIVWVRLA